MPIDIEAPRITSRESPREILVADFKSLRELPIRGGWGYTLEDAVIIDKGDPIVPKGMPFDGVGIEHAFVEKRIYEELIIFRSENDKCSGIQWTSLGQSLTTHDERKYDVLKYEVTAFRDHDWEELKAEWEGPNGHDSPNFDMDAHESKRSARTLRYVTHYWFDITSFVGST